MRRDSPQGESRARLQPRVCRQQRGRTSRSPKWRLRACGSAWGLALADTQRRRLCQKIARESSCRLVTDASCVNTEMPRVPHWLQSSGATPGASEKLARHPRSVVSSPRCRRVSLRSGCAQTEPQHPEHTQTLPRVRGASPTHPDLSGRAVWRQAYLSGEIIPFF